MKPSRVLLLLAVLCLALPVLAAGAKPNPVPQVKHEIYKLSNGLTVILAENHEVPIVGVNVNYQVGSKNEKPGRTGFAHLFEHMMFEGSKNWNKDYSQPLESVGADVNGGTNTDRTRYCELLPPAYLERALWLEADRMGFLLDALSEERLKNQISVVKNERRQSYENRPYGTVREKMVAALYPPDHPYHWTTIGSMEDLSAASVEDVKEFFRTYYAPNNASLCIVGDFDTAAVKKLVEKYFGAIPPGPPVSRIQEWVPTLPGEVELAIQDRVQLPRTYVDWHTGPIYGEDDAAMDVFGDVLGGGKTSRLYQRLVNDLQIAQEVSAANDGSQIAGLFEMTLTPRPGKSLGDVEKEAFAVLKEALEKGITQEELDRTVTGYTAIQVKGIARIGLFGGIPDRMNGYVHYLGDADRFRWDLQRYLDLTPEKVNAAARKYLGPNRVVARVTPLGKLAADSQGEAASVDRTVMPGPGAEKPFKLGERQRFTLKNGLPVVLVERHQAPIVEYGLAVKGGSSTDPAGKEGLCALTLGVLQEGAGGLSSKAFAEAVETQGATLYANATQDAAMFRASALKDKQDKVLALFADLVARPNLIQADFDRIKALQVTGLVRAMEQPAALGNALLARILGGETPYGHPTRGTKPGLEAAGLEDVKAYWSRWGVPKNAVLVVVGDTTKAELEPALEKTFGSWTGGEAPALPKIEAPVQAGRTIYVADRPGSAQSVIYAAQSSLPRSAPDFATMEAANYPLGGGSQGRLYRNLRQDKGYTYGAYSQLAPLRTSGVFVASASVATDVTAPALKEMMAEIEGIVGKSPITADELAQAKAELAGGYPKSFETAGQLVGGIQQLASLGVPDSELDAYPGKIEALTLDQVRAEAVKGLKPAGMSLLVVGDKAKVVPVLEKIGLGQVVEVPSSWLPVPPAKEK